VTFAGLRAYVQTPHSFITAIMKKTALALLIFFGAFSISLHAQSQDYRVFLVQVSTHYNDFNSFNADIDTMNAHGATYSKLYGHFTYGFGFVRKKSLLETGGHMYWGNTKEMVSGTSDTVNNEIVFTDYWVRQRLLSFNYRIGLAMGNHLSLGTDLGGVLSNFQHLKIDHEKTPLWFINFSGQRSLVSAISPYLSIHALIEESTYLNIEPYATFTFGETRYDQAFDSSVFYPNSSIGGHMRMRFYGVRISIGIGSIL
jgi:hypothetical protein